MKFRVVVTPEAQSGIREAFGHIRQNSPLNAERWLRSLSRKISTLENMPVRCGFALERDYLDEDLRQTLLHSHRIIFRVDTPQKVVWVLAIRHAKRRALGEPAGEDDQE